jgi:hypothetical protein
MKTERNAERDRICSVQRARDIAFIFKSNINGILMLSHAQAIAALQRQRDPVAIPFYTVDRLRRGHHPYIPGRGLDIEPGLVFAEHVFVSCLDREKPDHIIDIGVDLRIIIQVHELEPEAVIVPVADREIQVGKQTPTQLGITGIFPNQFGHQELAMRVDEQDAQDKEKKWRFSHNYNVPLKSNVPKMGCLL